MCGRYILAEEPNKIYGRYHFSRAGKDEKPLFSPMYNIAPGSLVPIITKNSPLRIELMRWGLIPHWSKDPRIGYKLINARAETIEQKPSFKDSFKNKRCLVPATGFYEWQKTKDGKIPYIIRLKSRKIFSMAGIYDVWKDAEGKGHKTFLIITTSANSLIEVVHNRMPVIINEHNEIQWLDSSTLPSSLKEYLKPYQSSQMERYTVSAKVNDPRNQEAELLNEVNY